MRLSQFVSLVFVNRKHVHNMFMETKTLRCERKKKKEEIKLISLVDKMAVAQ